MHGEPSYITIVMLMLLVVAAAHDSIRHKIPNYISLGIWLVIPLLNAMASGLDGFLDSLYGLLLALALTFPLYAMRWMGAGDVKLMAGVGAFVGPGAVLPVLGFIFVCGALFAIALHLYKKTLSETLGRLSAMFSLTAAMRKTVYVPPVDATAQVLIPYAVPIALGTLCFLAYVH